MAHQLYYITVSSKYRTIGLNAGMLLKSVHMHKNKNAGDGDTLKKSNFFFLVTRFDVHIQSSDCQNVDKDHRNGDMFNTLLYY
jgi:hypothetical protein